MIKDREYNSIIKSLSKYNIATILGLLPMSIISYIQDIVYMDNAIEYFYWLLLLNIVIMLCFCMQLIRYIIILRNIPYSPNIMKYSYIICFCVFIYILDIIFISLDYYNVRYNNICGLSIDCTMLLEIMMFQKTFFSNFAVIMVNLMIYIKFYGIEICMYQVQGQSKPITREIKRTQKSTFG